MKTLKRKFIAGAGDLSAIPPDVAERLWDMMAAFAGYGFPKAHAASYALTAWRSAWCKAHYPAEFMAAVMANWGGYYRQETYILEALRLGLKVNAPHINHSRSQFSVAHLEGEAQLFMGLDQVRDLTTHTQQRIMRLRPFQSLADFLTRAFPSRKEAQHLIEVGALDGLGGIPTLLKELDGGLWRKGQPPLFAASPGALADWTDEQKAAAQQRLLGVSLLMHPLARYAAQLEGRGVLSTLEAEQAGDEEVRVAGLRQTWRRISRPNQEALYYADLGDLEGTLRVRIRDAVYRRYRGELAGKAPILVVGRIARSQRTGEAVLEAEEIERL